MNGWQRRLNSDTGHAYLQKRTADCACVAAQSAFAQYSTIFNDILHMSILAGTHVFKAYPAYTTTLRYESALNVVRCVRFQYNSTYNDRFCLSFTAVTSVFSLVSDMPVLFQ